MYPTNSTGEVFNVPSCILMETDITVAITTITVVILTGGGVSCWDINMPSLS